LLPNSLAIQLNSGTCFSGRAKPGGAVAERCVGGFGLGRGCVGVVDLGVFFAIAKV
jgi:hypothetical protein